VNVNYTLENTSDVTLRLTSIQGQTIKEVKTNNAIGLQTNSVDISNQSSGMYFVTITTETESFTTKVIKR
ncbi:MAG: T9SS type A sorting domain-containing protein, partial [Bacteroidota bacterium]